MLGEAPKVCSILAKAQTINNVPLKLDDIHPVDYVSDLSTDFW